MTMLNVTEFVEDDDIEDFIEECEDTLEDYA
jgi:hypothetical protein